MIRALVDPDVELNYIPYRLRHKQLSVKERRAYTPLTSRSHISVPKRQYDAGEYSKGKERKNYHQEDMEWKIQRNEIILSGVRHKQKVKGLKNIANIKQFTVPWLDKSSESEGSPTQLEQRVSQHLTHSKVEMMIGEGSVGSTEQPFSNNSSMVVTQKQKEENQSNHVDIGNIQQQNELKFEKQQTRAIEVRRYDDNNEPQNTGILRQKSEGELLAKLDSIVKYEIPTESQGSQKYQQTSQNDPSVKLLNTNYLEANDAQRIDESKSKSLREEMCQNEDQKYHGEIPKIKIKEQEELNLQVDPRSKDKEAINAVKSSKTINIQSRKEERSEDNDIHEQETAVLASCESVTITNKAKSRQINLPSEKSLEPSSHNKHSFEGVNSEPANISNIKSKKEGRSEQNDSHKKENNAVNSESASISNKVQIRQEEKESRPRSHKKQTIEGGHSGQFQMGKTVRSRQEEQSEASEKVSLESAKISNKAKSSQKERSEGSDSFMKRQSIDAVISESERIRNKVKSRQGERQEGSDSYKKGATYTNQLNTLNNFRKSSQSKASRSSNKKVSYQSSSAKQDSAQVISSQFSESSVEQTRSQHLKIQPPSLNEDKSIPQDSTFEPLVTFSGGQAKNSQSYSSMPRGLFRKGMVEDNHGECQEYKREQPYIQSSQQNIDVVTGTPDRIQDLGVKGMKSDIFEFEQKPFSAEIKTISQVKRATNSKSQIRLDIEAMKQELGAIIHSSSSLHEQVELTPPDISSSSSSTWRYNPNESSQESPFRLPKGILDSQEKQESEQIPPLMLPQGLSESSKQSRIESQQEVLDQKQLGLLSSRGVQGQYQPQGTPRDENMNDADESDKERLMMINLRAGSLYPLGSPDNVVQKQTSSLNQSLFRSRGSTRSPKRKKSRLAKNLSRFKTRMTEF